jgi:ankyrin repeat protein
MTVIAPFGNNHLHDFGPRTLLETAANAFVLSGTRRDAFEGLVKLLDAGCLPHNIQHPALRPGEGWAHYLACCGQEPLPSLHSITLATRFKLLLEAGVGRDHVDHRSLLMAAVESRNLPALEALIALGETINLNFTDRLGQTALHHAACDPQKLSALKELVSALSKDDLNRTDLRGRSALRLAVEKNNTDAAQALLNAGAVEPADAQRTIGPLPVARYDDVPGPRRELLTETRPATPLLQVAASLGNAGMVALLCAQLSAEDLKAQGAKPLRDAARSLHVDVMKTLLEKGVAADARDEGDVTVLVELMQSLPELMKYFPRSVDEKLPAAIGLLKQYGADVNATLPCAGALQSQQVPDINEAGATPLHWAVEHQHTPSIRALMAAGANPGAVAENHKTPRDLAADHPEILQLLAAPPAGEDDCALERPAKRARQDAGGSSAG